MPIIGYEDERMVQKTVGTITHNGNRYKIDWQDEPTLQMMPLDQLIVTAQQMRVSVGRPILRNAGGILNHIFVL